MCVILYLEDDKKRPSEDMITKMWERNPHGTGAAWRETVNGKPVVRFVKGLNLAETRELFKTIPIPSVVHLRRATSGGILPKLCHPFLISPESKLAVEGTTPGWVLFHNGDWKEWDKWALDLTGKSGLKVPRGKMSDSRFIAVASDFYGVSFMNYLPTQKGVAFGPEEDDFELFEGEKGWTEVEGIWCSNDNFLHEKLNEFGHVVSRNATYHGHNSYQYNTKLCLAPACMETKDLDHSQRCPKHQFKAVTGVTADKLPFQKAEPVEKVLSLDLCERMHKENRMSKQMLKNFRKAYNTLRSGSQKDKTRAMKELADLSTIVINLRGRT